MKLSRKISILASFLVSLSYLMAQDASAKELGLRYYMNLELLSITEARDPWFPFNDRRLLFTYQHSDSTVQKASYSKNQPKLVGIAFEHEDFSTVHVMSKNEAGIFTYILEIDRKTQDTLQQKSKDIVYRYVIDGVWMADPRNPNRVKKLNGAVLSVFPTKQIPQLDLLSPEIKPVANRDGKHNVILRYVGTPNQEVFVGGTFNSFDPYLHTLKENYLLPGVYEIELRLRPGMHYYYFVVDGVKMLDSRNRERGWMQGSTNQGDYSVITIEERS